MNLLGIRYLVSDQPINASGEQKKSPKQSYKNDCFGLFKKTSATQINMLRKILTFSLCAKTFPMLPQKSYLLLLNFIYIRHNEKHHLPDD